MQWLPPDVSDAAQVRSTCNLQLLYRSPGSILGPRNAHNSGVSSPRMLHPKKCVGLVTFHDLETCEWYSVRGSDDPLGGVNLMTRSTGFSHGPGMYCRLVWSFKATTM